GDFGTVKGIEITIEGYWPALHVRAGYALQSAKGVTSSPFEDPGSGLTDERVQFPLAFDLPHAADLVVSAGRAAGAMNHRWGLTLTGMLRSGYPLSRTVPEFTPAPVVEQRLPWTGLVNLRASYDFGSLPGCPRCSWRVIADARNLTGRENVIALRRDTGTLAPSAEDLQRVASEVPDDIKPIPRESPDYSALVDLNRDGLITADELRTGRFAAALDRSDPSLYFGSAQAFRLGIEVAF
ncbi:MAG: TonB-dependent receptor, partial [Myxococcales bacterium]